MLFASVLQLSICRRQSMHSWCERCAKYTPTVSINVCTSGEVLSSLHIVSVNICAPGVSVVSSLHISSVNISAPV